jgi:hypothetical protein
LLKRFSGSPAVEKAGAEFEHAREIEETFHKDFDGLNFTFFFPAPDCWNFGQLFDFLRHAFSASDNSIKIGPEEPITFKRN